MKDQASHIGLPSRTSYPAFWMKSAIHRTVLICAIAASSQKTVSDKEMQILNNTLLTLLSLHCDMIVQGIHNEPSH